MRAPIISSAPLFSNAPTAYTSCAVTGTSVTGCTNSSPNYSTLRTISRSTTFTSCKWSSCTASRDSGSAIKCTGANTILIINECHFYSCSAYQQGGAIHTSSFHTLDVNGSFFLKCSSSIYETDNFGSGAIWIYGIQQKLSISNNLFVSCTSKASGGASIIQECSSNIRGAEVINNCRYIDCNVTDQSPDGGAVWISTNENLIGFMNCLFSMCNSGKYGGALRHECSEFESNSYPILYCFFNKNKGIYGNDLFVPSIPSDDACLYCFSTSNPGRIGYYGSSNPLTIDLDWLPLGDISLYTFTDFEMLYALQLLVCTRRDEVKKGEVEDEEIRDAYRSKSKLAVHIPSTASSVQVSLIKQLSPSLLPILRSLNA